MFLRCGAAARIAKESVSCPWPDPMDPGGSELDSSLPQPENPCLIVEDSQPDSVALEDDPETSYRALLARRLSSLQPTARSPVLVRFRLM